MDGVRISAARRAQLDRTADDLIERAVDASSQLRASPSSALAGWKLVRQKAGLRVFRPQGAACPSAKDPVPLLGTGTIPGTVEDAITGTYADSSAALRTSKALLSDKLIDGAVLQVLIANPPTAGVVFSGIKWFALKAPAGGQFIRDRDLLTYERQGRIVDRGGRFFAYHVYHSIDLPEWPRPQDSGLTRAFMSMCYLYSASDPSSSAGDPSSFATLDCFMLGRFHPGGSVPPALGAFVAAERMLSVANVAVCAQAKRFSRLAARAAERCVPSESLYRCDLCRALLSSAPSAASTVECAGCRRRACKRCHTRRPVFRLHPRTRRPEKDVFCRECVDLVARASGGVGGFRIGRHKWTEDGDRSGDRTGDEFSGSSSSGYEDPAAGHNASHNAGHGRPHPQYLRPRSSSEDSAAHVAADPQWDGKMRQRARTDACPHVKRDGDEDAATRTGRSQSLLFDPERQLYIRVFNDADPNPQVRPQTQPLPPTRRAPPHPPHPPHPHAVVRTARPAARHGHSAEDVKAARAERPAVGRGRGRGQRDCVFSVDALD